jgi:hypothetical protein
VSSLLNLFDGTARKQSSRLAPQWQDAEFGKKNIRGCNGMRDNIKEGYLPCNAHPPQKEHVFVVIEL